MTDKKNIRLLLYSSNIWYFAEGMLGPLLAIYSQHLGGDILDITWAWAIYLIVAGILYIFIGSIADKLNKKESIMVGGYVLNTIFTFAFLFVSNIWQLFLVQAGLGVAAAMSAPTWYAIYAKYSPKDKEGYHWGISGGTAQIITGIAIVIGGLVITLASFKVLFFTMGVIQLIGTIYLAQILRKK